MPQTRSVSRNDVLQRLSQHRLEMNTRFGVASLALFGSASRDELNPDSDIDVIVHFGAPATLASYFDLKFYLEEVLGCEVDLATEQMVKPRLLRRIEGELIYVA